MTAVDTAAQMAGQTDLLEDWLLGRELGHVVGCLDGCPVGCVDGWLNGCTVGCVDGFVLAVTLAVHLAETCCCASGGFCAWQSFTVPCEI